MKNRKNIIAAVAVVIAAIAAAAFFMSLKVTGSELFDFSAVDENCSVYVIRNDKEVSDFVDDRHLTEHKKYLLDSEQTQQFFDLMNSTVYRRKFEINIFSFVPGISMTSASTHDPVNYRIIAEDKNGKEVLHILTFGCDYVTYILQNDTEISENIKITDGKWYEKMENILADAQLTDTYFDEIP